MKLVVTPVLIGAASLAGRHWGAAVGGWLVGIPFTSAPVAFFLALEHGTGFATSASVGMMLGTISQAVFCLAYAWGAYRGASWSIAFGLGCIGFAASTVVLNASDMPPAPGFMVTLAALIAVLFIMPKVPEKTGKSPSPDQSLPRWDIPMRMVIATAFVLLLTSVAPVLGSHLSGLLSPFPLFGAVLVVFVHRSERAGAAVRLLRGLLLGLYAPAGFFVVLAVAIQPVGISIGFTIAIATALALQGITLRLLRRSALAG